MNSQDKLLIHRYGSFTLILLLMFFLLVLCVRLERKHWESKLGEQVDRVLSLSEMSSTYSVARALPVHTNLEASCCVFMLSDYAGRPAYAAIVRITGPSGPVPCVYFARSALETPMFIGTAGVPQTSRAAVESYLVTSAQVSYWSQKISLLLEGIIR